MKLYNSLTRKVEPFEPAGEEASLYVCGITPYDTTHLGHAFTYTAADILVRYLEFKGYQVRYVQNVTDIDDDILRKAKEAGENWKAVGDRWTTHFIRDMQALNVRAPDYYPRATEVIPEILESVQDLLDEGHAYEAGGSVYFQVDSWREFGKLSALAREEMLPIANERGNNPDDPNKRDPLDFVLWQAQAPGEPAWASPWGPGRPGWHIECSTMSTHFLGNTIDIHGGGADLCFPHHECEIAQVEPVAEQKPFVRFWMHTAMVSLSGEKMSKSLGNLVMVNELLEDYSADGLRIYMGRHHYRDPWTHDEELLEESEQLARRALEAVRIASKEESEAGAEDAMTAFVAAMDDDLDTTTAIDVFAGLTRSILEAAASGRPVKQAQSILREMGGVFGLQLDAGEPERRVLQGWNRHLTRFQEI